MSLAIAHPGAPLSRIEERTAARQHVVTVGETIGTVEGVNKAAKFGSTIIALLGKILGSLSDCWHTLNGALRGCVDFLEVVDIVARITEWAKGSVKGSWKIASRVCLTAFRVFTVINFLERVKLINMCPVVDWISQIPVLGYIVNVPSSVLGIAAFSLSAVNNSLEIKGFCTKLKLRTNMLEAKKLRTQALADPSAAARLEAAYVDAILNVRHARVSLGKLRSVDTTAAGINQIKAQWQAVSNSGHRTTAALPNKIKKIELKVDMGKVERNKSIVAVVNDIIKVSCITLFMLGSFLGGILAASTFPMLTLGLMTAGIGLYKVFHDRYAAISVEKSAKAIASIP